MMEATGAPRNFRIGENDRKNHLLSFGSIARDIFLEKFSVGTQLPLTSYLHVLSYNTLVSSSSETEESARWEKKMFFYTRKACTKFEAETV